MCETKSGTEADVEEEDVNVVGGVDKVGVSVYESQGSTLSESLLLRRRSRKNVSKGVVDTTHLPQCEFLNLQLLPITFLLEFFCWPVIELF